MKLPSINYLISNSKESFLRFPLTIISSLVAVCIAIYMIEYKDNIENMFPYINLLLTAALGIPLYFCSTIFINRINLNKNLKIVSMIGATCLLIVIYFTLPDSNVTHNTSVPYIRYGIYNIIIHLLVSFIPYIHNKQLNGFWNYNKILFIRLLTSVLYSGFLYLGLVLALVALKILFNIDIQDELFFEVFIVIIGFFNTWFFVTGIPKQLDELENIKTYPKGLKIFSQFVLLPLLILYLIILYGYGTKILIQWDWPKGIVSYLISCVSVLGIFTFLLIHPYKFLKENSWIKNFSKIYYFILFPLIIILFIAIGMRIDDYGVTINRYVIVLLGIWLTIICFYFSIGKTNIKFIPKSLAIILLLMIFGPWGMFSVSENSQTNRLINILEKNSILTDSKINNEVFWNIDSLPNFYSQKENINENLLDDSTHNEIKSILDYLDDYHGFSNIRPLFKQNIDSLINASIKSDKQLNEARIYMKTLGLKYQHYYSSSESNYFTYSSTNNKVISINNYDYLVNFNHYSYDRKNAISSFTIDSIKYTIEYIPEINNGFMLISVHDTINFKFNSLINKLENEYGNNNEPNIQKNKMTLNESSSIFDLKVEIDSINIHNVNDSLKIKSIEGGLFFRKKK
ncbi:MAG: DUF4153 domain-containing protein [Bacteroidales bacterium]|nr:DUF4153 domain-containing protein [Bacteroidales bacterium]